MIRKEHHHFKTRVDGDTVEPEYRARGVAAILACASRPARACSGVRQVAVRTPEKKRARLRNVTLHICKKKKRAKVNAGRWQGAQFIQHMTATVSGSRRHADVRGQPFMEMLFGKLPDFFQSDVNCAGCVERAGYTGKALQGLADKGIRARPARRDAKDYRCGKE